MVALLGFTLTLFDSSFRSKSRLEAENAALRHQLTVLRRRVRGRVQLTNSDRLFFMQLYRWFPSVLKAITIERPETLVRWHRVGLSPVVCTDNLRPYVLVTESPNVMGDDRTVMFLTGAVRLAVQIKEPARGRERCTSASTDRAAAEGEGACPTLERRSLVPHPVVSMFPSVLKAVTIIQPATLVLGTGPAFDATGVGSRTTRRTTADRGGPARTRPADEHRESILGSAAHSWRTAQARV
jgi:hypothetical protein